MSKRIIDSGYVLQQLRPSEAGDVQLDGCDAGWWRYTLCGARRKQRGHKEAGVSVAGIHGDDDAGLHHSTQQLRLQDGCVLVPQPPNEA